MKKNINNNLSKIIKKEHFGKWVAVSNDYKKVIGYSNNLKELADKFSNKVIYMKALSPETQYSFI